MRILREKKVSSLNMFPGMNTAEIILLTGGGMKLLKTITEEGTYQIPVEKDKPVVITYHAPNKISNRIPVRFLSGCAYINPDEIRVFGILAVALTNVSNSAITALPDLILIPTDTTLTVLVDTQSYNVSLMSTSGVRLHIFQ